MSYSRYYRYKLLTAQKKLYDELLKGIQNESTEIVIPGDWSEEDIQKVVFAVDYDNPELYYADLTDVRILKSKISAAFQMRYYCKAAERKKYDRMLQKAAVEILVPLLDQEKEDICLKIHDWLVFNCTYGDCDRFANASYSIIGVLLYHTAVCEGIAKTYKYLADLMRLRCIVAVGNAIGPNGTEEGHAWNIIRINNRCYHLDATLEQCIDDRYCSKAYYLLSTKEILRDHKFHPFFVLPYCDQTKNRLETVHSPSELLAFFISESKCYHSYSEVRVSRELTREKLMHVIDYEIPELDIAAYCNLKEYWFAESSRVLYLHWR